MSVFRQIQSEMASELGLLGNENEKLKQENTILRALANPRPDIFQLKTIGDFVAQIQHLEAENAKLRAALEYYADHGNWQEQNANWKFVNENTLITLNNENGWEVAENALKDKQL